MSLPDIKTVPPTTEHMEAYQASVDTMRAEAVASMTPEEQARMKVMESVSRQLEEAKIPFALWANPLTDRVRFWRFNRLDYLPENATFKERGDVIMKTQFWCLAPTMAQWTFAGAVKYAAYYGAQQEMLYGYVIDEKTQQIKVVLPEEKA